MRLINKILDNVPGWALDIIGVLFVVIVCILVSWAFTWIGYFVSKVLPMP